MYAHFKMATFVENIEKHGEIPISEAHLRPKTPHVAPFSKWTPHLWQELDLPPFLWNHWKYTLNPHSKNPRFRVSEALRHGEACFFHSVKMSFECHGYSPLLADFLVDFILGRDRPRRAVIYQDWLTRPSKSLMLALVTENHHLTQFWEKFKATQVEPGLHTFF